MGSTSEGVASAAGKAKGDFEDRRMSAKVNQPNGTSTRKNHTPLHVCCPILLSRSRPVFVLRPGLEVNMLTHCLPTNLLCVGPTRDQCGYLRMMHSLSTMHILSSMRGMGIH